MSRSTSPGVDSSDEASDFSEKILESSEAWLDEMCLEPLLAPEPGFSKLCNACRRVFCVHSGNALANHVQNHDTLVLSAQRGCVLCSQILYRLEGQDLSYRLSPQLNIRYQDGPHEFHQGQLEVKLNCFGTWLMEFSMIPIGDYSRLPFIPIYANVCSFRNTFSIFEYPT